MRRIKGFHRFYLSSANEKNLRNQRNPYNPRSELSITNYIDEISPTALILGDEFCL
jgi:hypothetical protein